MTGAPARRFGLAEPHEVRGLSGREFLQGIVDGRLPGPPIGAPLNFALVEVGDGFAAFEGEPSEALLNPMGTVHGGWALTLIDSATACACLSQLPSGAAMTTVETKGNFSRPILKDSGRVRCEGRVVARGRRIVSSEARVLDAAGRVLAHGTSTLMIVVDGAVLSA